MINRIRTWWRKKKIAAMRYRHECLCHELAELGNEIRRLTGRKP